MLERLATLALFLSVACGAALLINLAMDLYDRLLERIIPNDLPEQVAQARGFEDFWEQVQHEWDLEGEPLPAATCTAAAWCAGRPAAGDTRCRIHILLDQGQPA